MAMSIGLAKVEALRHGRYGTPMHETRTDAKQISRFIPSLPQLLEDTRKYIKRELRKLYAEKRVT